MRIEIVYINNKYFAVRVKKWYSFKWKYLGEDYKWTKKDIANGYVMCNTYTEALNKIDRFFPTIDKIVGFKRK